MHNLTNKHYQSLKRLLRYIKGTQHYGIPFIEGDLTLQTFVDADWAADQTDRKSVTGFCSFLGPNLLSWQVKKQATVSKSSTEAEYRALSSATSDVIWLRRLLAEFHENQLQPTVIHCDNTSALALAKNPVFHARTKHIEIYYHFISEHVKSNAITLHHINSADQPADILTKALSPARFCALRTKLTIQSQDAQLARGC
ncbi:Retrovirus-related Pol polyprotein from transposon TNT 1-94 [Dendrobium catenatum]|uniref:Retrovirus-related Pol polyprotein from transposon TNT 1-94 n=1 Tax=Dendrobium catenatum TaxID=906689 RepID=A0A2I0X8B3_9ASPA|nr:Retrovirus-related Pol polyprotein from transposon TNT 1-94 [Dendrobium catenatum]